MRMVLKTEHCPERQVPGEPWALKISACGAMGRVLRWSHSDATNQPEAQVQLGAGLSLNVRKVQMQLRCSHEDGTVGGTAGGKLGTHCKRH